MPRNPVLRHLFVTSWALAIVIGFWSLVKYEVSPGRAAAAGIDWPSTGELVLAHGQPTLIMAVHPECPCSKASMEDLAELVARYPNRLNCYILFVPVGPITADDCRKSDLWAAAAAISDVKPLVDNHKLAIEK